MILRLMVQELQDACIKLGYFVKQLLLYVSNHHQNLNIYILLKDEKEHHFLPWLLNEKQNDHQFDPKSMLQMP